MAAVYAVWQRADYLQDDDDDASSVEFEDAVDTMSPKATEIAVKNGSSMFIDNSALCTSASSAAIYQQSTR